MKYIHKFNSKLSCEVEVFDGPPPSKGERHIINIQWTGQPKKKHMAEYIRWMHIVNDRYAKQWNMRIMHIFQGGPSPKDWEFWGYAPDEPPKRIRIPFSQEVV